MMNQELKNMCEKLDETLVEYFFKLKQFYQEQAVLEQYMKAGFLNLSRARYNMGAKAVGTSQFNETSMKALAKVDTDNASGVTSDIFHLASAIPDPSKSGTTSLRKRQGGEGKEESVDNDRKKEMQDLPVDPIKWFGVLVPQNLRRSQIGFKHAVESVVTIANLKNSLCTLRTEYRTLLKQKTVLVTHEADE